MEQVWRDSEIALRRKTFGNVLDVVVDAEGFLKHDDGGRRCYRVLRSWTHPVHAHIAVSGVECQPVCYAVTGSCSGHEVSGSFLKVGTGLRQAQINGASERSYAYIPAYLAAAAGCRGIGADAMAFGSSG